MKRRTLKTTAYVMAALMAFGGMSMTAEATGSVLPSGGIGIKLAMAGSSLGEISGKTAIPVERMIETVEASEDNAEMDKLYKDIVVCTANDYASLRSLPDVTSEVLGKMPHNSVGTLINESDGWCFVVSGNAAGYIREEYLLLGEEAAAEAKKIAKKVATPQAQAVCVREKADAESDTLAYLPEGEEILVLEEKDGWAKVDIEEGFGWISTEHVSITTEFKYGESKAEENERLAAEAEERRRANLAAAKKRGKLNTTAYEIGEGSELGVAVVEYALQFVGNPYVYGGVSLTDGADCSGFVMSVYDAFGVELPHSSTEDRVQGYAVDGIENAQPGDIMCYSGHVAIYIGNGQIVHASNSIDGIIVSDASYRNTLAIRRIF